MVAWTEATYLSIYNIITENLSHGKREKVLIIGVDSEIGHALKNHLTIKSIEVYRTTIRVPSKSLYFDLNFPNYKSLKEKFTTVVICAGIVKISECENDP